MDNFFKNIPSSISNIHSIVQTLTMEAKQSKEDINTKRLTIENEQTQDRVETSQDFDRQITDLENLIKHLQDEIIESSIHFGKPSDYKANKSHSDIVEISNNFGKSSDYDTNVSDSDLKQLLEESEKKEELQEKRVYPILMKDIRFDLPNVGEYGKNSNITEIEYFNDGYSSIRKQFNVLWDNASEEFKKPLEVSQQNPQDAVSKFDANSPDNTN